jgi:hypothetical protein
MNGISDTLHLRRDELDVVIGRYPDLQIAKTSHEAVHRVTIPGEVCEQGYYLFLLHNAVALSSYNFCARIQTDAKFVARMRASIAGSADPSSDGASTDASVPAVIRNRHKRASR